MHRNIFTQLELQEIEKVRVQHAIKQLKTKNNTQQSMVIAVTQPNAPPMQLQNIGINNTIANPNHVDDNRKLLCFYVLLFIFTFFLVKIKQKEKKQNIKKKKIKQSC